MEENQYYDLIEKLFELVHRIEEKGNNLTKVKVWLANDYETFKNNVWFLKTLVSSYPPMQVIRLWAPEINNMDPEDEQEINELLSKLMLEFN